MKHPLFKRRSMSYDMWNYSATNTDVWVFGTPQAYLEFADLLTTRDGPQRIIAGDAGGMDLAILSPAQAPTSDFLILHERLVHRDGNFNMELIVGGSKKGLGFLADQFRRSAREHPEDVDNHFHIDDGDELLVMPSVFISIRGPLEDAESQLADLAPEASTDLLPDMNWRDPENWPYEPITDYDSLHGRLPINKTKGEQDMGLDAE